MLSLGSRVRYRGNDCIVVGRTRETHSRYDLLFPASGRIEQNVLERGPGALLHRSPASASVRTKVRERLHATHLREELEVLAWRERVLCSAQTYGTIGSVTDNSRPTKTLRNGRCGRAGP